MDLQLTSALIFLALLALVLFFKRKNLALQKIWFPFLYFVMYRTKIGLKFMDNTSKRHPRLLKFLGYFGVFIGFAGMTLLAFTLTKNLAVLLTRPEAVSGVGLVLPFKVKGAFYVPFFYWIISIFILAAVHEFSHGIIARLYGLKIKSSGLAFLCILLPIIPAAFVEPDEKKLFKKPAKEQLSVFAAGPFANILLAILVLLLFNFTLAPYIQSIMHEDGVKINGFIEGDISYPAKEAGISVSEIIIGIDDIEVNAVDNLSTALMDKKPGDSITLTTKNQSYEIILAENPENRSKAYLGVYLLQNFERKGCSNQGFRKYADNALIWLSGLFYWLFVLNLGIGLFNLVPIGPIDGGRMLHVALLSFFKKERADKIWKSVGFFFLFLVLSNILFGFFR